MAPDVSGGLRNSPTGAKSTHVLKKGPWTTSEDMILVEYVKKHGEGNWNAVQRNSGLMRCGKSCRLRWANHLRPNLKKGAFTPDEEKLIVELHAKLGNKWARMAAQLPGRTDNEIKNYWNTRLKRRQRAGLPIYPQEIALHQKHQKLNSSSPSPPSLSSILASSHPSNPNSLQFYDTFSSPSTQNHLSNTPYVNQQFKLCRGNNSSLALTLAASNSSFSSSANPFFNQGPSNNPLPIPSLFFRYNSLDYGAKTGPEMGVLGLPSIQSPAVTPAASSSDFVMAATTSSDGAEEYEVDRCNKSGEAFGFGHDNVNFDKNYEGPETKFPEEGNNAIDDDLLNLLDNFPLSVPIPNWDEVHGSESPILSNGTNRAIESQPDASEYNPVAASTGAVNQDWKFGSCLWNNMPSIY
ncbi:hypothetical protein DH2020_031527 [Rehmannia glutinosa]|uniref:R2R3-MYB protein n=1 Tax=Rehmannia glutinosa TaxID=99300 RepID=A0ABR0VLS1_REHGL